jgi:signal transduction histidine kinase
MKSFDRKLFTGIVLIVLLFLPVLISAIFSLNKVIVAQKKIGQYAEQLLVAGDLRRLKVHQMSLLPIFVLRGDESILKEITHTTEEFVNITLKLQSMTNDQRNKDLLTQIREEQKGMRALAMPGIQMKLNGASTNDVNNFFGKVTGPRTMMIMDTIDKIVKNINNDYEKEKTNNEITSRTIIRSLIFASALSILISLLVGYLLLKMIQQKKSHDKNLELLSKRERELSNARKETLEVVAHDLKNPLASILMSTQMILRRGVDRPENMLNLERILKSSESMKRLIDDLLDHSKIESGSFTLDKRECDVENLLKTLALRFEPIVAEKNIKLVCDTSAYLPNVAIDEGRIEQVIANFLQNAVKFTAHHGVIKISAKIQADHMSISVSDTGVGMTKEQAEHVFERYWQVRETASLGTGLGLAISKSIVHAHGGSIKVKSELGKGSTFSLHLPVVLPEFVLKISESTNLSRS